MKFSQLELDSREFIDSRAGVALFFEAFANR
jgi:hypothetical protein